MGLCESKACEGAMQHTEVARIDGEDAQRDYMKVMQDASISELDALQPRERALSLLADGSLRLLSGKWLVAQPEDYVIERRQDLPEEAFLAPDDAVELLNKMFGVVALSYGWLSQFHPDPEGFHLYYVRQYLGKHLQRFSRLADAGIFWDFTALPQCDAEGNERTAEEEFQWQKGLRALSSIFGSSHTVVLSLTLVPEDAEPLTEDEMFYRSSYLLRGWCLFECTVATLLKDADQLLDLGSAVEELESESAEWDEVQEKARGSRLPPLTPEDMAAELANRQFTYGEDIHFLTQTYEEFFMEAAGSATWLWFENSAANDGWGDEELRQFVRALPFFSKCQAVRLWGHHTLTEDGLLELTAAIPDQSNLGRMLLPKHLESTEQGQAMKDAWAKAGKMPGALMWC